MRVLTTIYLMFYFSILLSQSDWTLKLDKDDIKIYVKSVDSSKFKSFKAETAILVNMEDLLAFYKRGDNYKNWFEGCIESRIIEQASEHEYYFYTTTEAPWPISNRDNITKATFRKLATGNVKIFLKDFPQKRPVQENKVRIPFMEGYWLFEPQGANQTKITLEVLADPGGYLPAWVVNQFIAQTPYNTFQNLKRHFE